MNGAYTAPVQIGIFQKRALIVGVLFLVLFVAGAVINRPQFFRSYLVAYLFWAGIAIGSLALLMLQHLTGGGWGFLLQKLTRQGAKLAMGIGAARTDEIGRASCRERVCSTV